MDMKTWCTSLDTRRRVAVEYPNICAPSPRTGTSWLQHTSVVIIGVCILEDVAIQFQYSIRVGRNKEMKNQKKQKKKQENIGGEEEEEDIKIR